MPSDKKRSQTPRTTPVQPKLHMSNWLADHQERMQAEQDKWEQSVDLAPALKELRRADRKNKPRIR